MGIFFFTRNKFRKKINITLTGPVILRGLIDTTSF